MVPMTAQFSATILPAPAVPVPRPLPSVHFGAATSEHLLHHYDIFKEEALGASNRKAFKKVLTDGDPEHVVKLALDSLEPIRETVEPKS